MSFQNFKDFIEKEIEDYFISNLNLAAILADAGIDENLALDVEDDLLSHIDAKSMANALASSFSDKILRYEATPALMADSEGKSKSEYSCPLCYRQFGVWRSESRGQVDEPTISSQGKTIIILDDI